MGIAVTPHTKPSIDLVGNHPGEKDRSSLTIQIGIFIVAGSTLLIAALIYYAIHNPGWEKAALIGIEVIGWLLAGGSLTPVVKKNSTRIYLLIVAFTTLMSGIAILANGQTIPAALTALAFTILITSVSATDDTAERGLNLGMAGAWIIATEGLLIPIGKFNLPGTDAAFVTLLGILVMIYATLLAMEYISINFRLRLIFASLIIVILPLILVSLIQGIQVKNSVTASMSQTLESAADQTAFRVDEFLSTNLFDISEQAKLPIFEKYLEIPEKDRPGSDEEKDLKTTFLALNKRSQNSLVGFGLLDNQGQVVYDVVTRNIGSYEASTGYFAGAVSGKAYISDVIFSPEDDMPYIYFSSPIWGPTNKIAGVLRAKFYAGVLQSILYDVSEAIGPKTYPILLDENQLRIGYPEDTVYMYKTLAPLSEVQKMYLASLNRLPRINTDDISTNLVEISKNLNNNPDLRFFIDELTPDKSGDIDEEYVGISKVANKPWKVLYTQGADAVSTIISNQQRSTTLAAVFLAGIVYMFSALFSRSLTQPIMHLTKTAEKITEGDLTVNAPVTSGEIGTLANAFNVMTGRLRQFINELEERVRARTSELAEKNETLTFRNRQIQTISEVARTIASTTNLEDLLTEVTRLVSERFGFYHVGIFLVDENQEYAVLRAANSAGGKRMLARQHKLAVGQVGIVGNVTGSGKARIATDVGADATFFNNPDLPLTRSEMALPLIAGGKIIGALDVQSTQSDAFSEVDVEMFATLSDQVAIAIMNSRAFEETQHALEETRQLHQRYLKQEWSRETSEMVHQAYEYTSRGVTAREVSFIPEMNEVFTNGNTIIQNSDQDEKSASPAILGVPIKLKGETIGIIHLQDEVAGAREWSIDEIETVQSVAEEVAQALENARLFEQTVRRAERERKVIEITSKIRSTNDPQAMMQIAVEELQRALHVSRTQVVINRVDDDPSKNNGHSSGSNGNGRSI